MSPERYDAWYATPRGAWIGDLEYGLLREMVAPRPGETLLDVGCGTGYFTRHFAGANGIGWVAGADRDAGAVRFAADRGGAAYLVADGLRLPFADRSFDLAVGVTSLCFMPDERRALAEMLRVARRRVALGLLNRRSLLWLDKGRGEGRGAYGGAHPGAAARDPRIVRL
ncbi:MAG: class I SAM-dependent methyltransferase [Rhodocyclaceae bacterium]